MSRWDILLRTLDWTVMSLSLFNTITLLWLGLTVLLNAERRTWGTWAAGGGMVLGGLFYAGHSAVVGQMTDTFSSEMEMWWRVSWLPIIGVPYMWYLVTIAYTGVLRVARHRRWLGVTTLIGCLGFATLVMLHPLPTYHQIMYERENSMTVVQNLPLVALIYPIFSVSCLWLAIDALRHPQASKRLMGDLARQRAKPWLIASSLVLFAVSITVGLAMTWLLRLLWHPAPMRLLDVLPLMMGFDAVVSGLVAVVVVLTGQAIVRYEIFTGHVLPRGELMHWWRRTLVLAAGYGALLSATLSVPIRIEPILQLLLATLLMTLFYALLSWRSYSEHERSLQRLRPFVRSEHLYEHLVQPSNAPTEDALVPLQALCEEVLHAQQVYLQPLGSLAPLLGPGLAYPPQATLPVISDLAQQFHSPQTACVPVEPAAYGGAVWAVPLWSERGLIGVLLLGPQRDGGLYTQEMIEIARTTGERLIDTQASAAMARRLMTLQRERLAESQVVDRRTRRVLHDDVLPQIHATMLLLSGASQSQPTVTQALHQLGDLHRHIANLLHALPPTAAPEVARLGLIGALRQAVEIELADAFDSVTWNLAPEASKPLQALPALIAEVVFYAAREAVRNAARYGRAEDPQRLLHLTLSVHWQAGLLITIHDSGVGFGTARLGTNEHGGSGQGFALHSTMLAVVGGSLSADSVPGVSTTVTLTVPGSAWLSTVDPLSTPRPQPTDLLPAPLMAPGSSR